MAWIYRDPSNPAREVVIDDPDRHLSVTGTLTADGLEVRVLRYPDVTEPLATHRIPSASLPPSPSFSFYDVGEDYADLLIADGERPGNAYQLTVRSEREGLTLTLSDARGKPTGWSALMPWEGLTPGA